MYDRLLGRAHRSENDDHKIRVSLALGNHVLFSVTSVEQVVYSIYHMVLYSLPEGDGWVGC